MERSILISPWKLTDRATAAWAFLFFDLQYNHITKAIQNMESLTQQHLLDGRFLFFFNLNEALWPILSVAQC